MPATKADLIAGLKCSSSAQTWTDGPDLNENRPITCINWYTAFSFCAWDGARLPTEAEWEYAAAGGNDNRVSPWGDADATGSYAVFGSNPIANVGSRPLGAARWGHLDMSGNVEEFVLDIYDVYTSAPVTNFARLTPASGYVVTRGGAWTNAAGMMRTVWRSWNSHDNRMALSGVRCARSS